MAEWVAGKGTTALGIIGTVLGSLGTLGNGLGSGIMTAAESNGNPSRSAACMYDLENANRLAEKDAQIAELRGQDYTNKSIIELYKYIDGELKEMREQAANRWTDQAVINANLSNANTALSGQVASTANALAQITKNVVPSSAICDVGCCSCGCNNNI